MDSLIPEASPAATWLQYRESLGDWDEAYQRVESYFAHLHVDNKLLLSSLVHKILNRAHERHLEEPARPPIELAAEEADRLLVQWFRKVLGEAQHEEEDRLSARGRMSLLLIETEIPWQELFLNDDPIPEEYAEALRTAYLRANPEFSFSEMRPQPIDLGIVDTANRTIERFGDLQLFVQWILWFTFTALLIGLFFVTR